MTTKTMTGMRIMNLKELLTKKDELAATIATIEDGIRPQLAPIKAELSEVEKAIESTVSGPAKANFAAAQKDTGTVHFELDGVHVKVTCDKTVKWDQAKLEDIFNKIRTAGDNPNQYIKTDYKVSETSFKEWPDAVKAVFTPARTVTPGKPKFEFHFNEDSEIPF